MVLSLQSQFNVWHLDDRTVAGDQSTIFDDLKQVVSTADGSGIELNISKFETHVFGGNTDEKTEVLIQLSSMYSDNELPH